MVVPATVVVLRRPPAFPPADLNRIFAVALNPAQRGGHDLSRSNDASKFTSDMYSKVISALLPCSHHIPSRPSIHPSTIPDATAPLHNRLAGRNNFVSHGSIIEASTAVKLSQRLH